MGLGIDCETQLSDSSAAEIAPWVMHRDDLNCQVDIAISYGLLLTLIFSAKESLFKALAPRHNNIPGYDSFSVSRVTEKTLLLNAEFALNNSDKSNNAFEIAYTIEHQNIITIAVLAQSFSD